MSEPPHRRGCALGIDLALRAWRDVGAAIVGWRGTRWTRWRTRVRRPQGEPTAAAVAAWIDALARESGARAVGLDGPLGWRDPDTPPALPGVGRRADYAVRAQAKVGAYGRCYPGTQLRWTAFCVDVFGELLARDGVVLANAEGAARAQPPPGGYLLLEVFPTACWRGSGLAPLPSKRRSNVEVLAERAQALRDAFGLPRRATPGHDDLQATVAALPAAALVGGPAVAQAHGAPAGWRPTQGQHPAHRVEGLVWTASPRRRGRGPHR